ncbi:biotin--[acetyl-CoA-carboxylase] ligase [Methylobacterium sp. Leaf456]|uniref:biotin--[acetyl-CoA-carboxylase] ligase n=1 Tax=Methylobacterium sp. Leaf456 TaxID=1736382 RepID=UPI0006F35EFD|nr:biotin--[acetyl-CoA-carboxylase] ligase [Methylobacterium sp. Leaf456]KQT61094.1 biotin--[acetyl-CoA-carboxylase] ligase [Methylobacterium sp. Leaf456]
MTFRLSPAARADGHRLHSHDRLGSTNTEALARARDGETGPLWIATRVQEAGRGRRGNVWQSPEGNLFASLLWPVAGVAPEMVATLGFVAGVALVDAIRNVCRGNPSPRTRGEGRDDPVVGAASGSDGEGAFPGEPPPSTPPHHRLPARSADDEVGRALSPRAGRGDAAAAFRLKWPNDILMDGQKLAGILLEAEQLPGGRRAVVIGFGVNVAAAPDDLPYPAAALRPAHAVDAPILFESLTERFVEAARIWNKGRGFQNIRQLWLERAAGVGAPVSVRTAETVLSGTFDTIDEGGRLVILAPDGTRRTVTAGEVHFGRAATAA